LSFSEIQCGIENALACDSVFSAKPAMMRAFKSAKNAVKVKGKGEDTTGDD